MDQSVELEAVKAEAFRKLGRNISNFAKLEAGFKHLLSISQLQLADTDEQTLRDQLLSNQTRLKKQTLGTLVEAFNRDVLSNVEPPEPTLNAETRIAFSIKLTYGDPSILKQQKRKLQRIVAERNRLIHHDLPFLTSVEDYRKLISHLDEQNLRLLNQLDELRWMVESLAEHGKALLKLAESPDFFQNIKANQTDSNA